MTKVTHIDHTGKELPKLTLSDQIFAAKVNPTLMAQAIRVYLDRQHQHTSKTKTRGEVALTTAKWFKQKGTGRARHGSQAAPIFVGGGVAHGPTGVRAAAKTLPAKMRRLSLIGALSDKAQNSKITIISDLDKISSKTSDINKMLKALGLTKKILLLTAKPYEKLVKASSNLTSLNTSYYQKVNTLRVLSSNHLLIDQEALSSIETWLLPAKKKAQVAKEAIKTVEKDAPKTAKKEIKKTK